MSLVRFDTDGAVAVVQLDRPPVNALSEELGRELVDVFGRCADPDIRAVVVTGEPHFAAGADIKGFLTTYETGDRESIATSIADAAWALEGLAKPTIAAVHGFALGGGLELAMAADFRYLSEDARVGQPEINLGVIPGAGGTQRLPRIVGYQRAKELVYSGRHVTAAEALEIRLADRVVPAERLLETATSDAAEWAKGPTLAIAAAKRAINDGWGHTLEQGMQIEASAFEDVFWTEDAKEGVKAFVEKRKAEFQGR
jgi:enoyl-CoA hydratase/carnithine racemase